ncbi:MAG: Gfo/Idh/MocA family oxidoreductase, partial [Candidatus Bathyarchaeia archaeon]
MSKARPNIGIVGLGFQGNNHAKALVEIGNPPTAVYDVQKEAVSKAASAYKAKPYYDYDSFLSDKSIDGVIIASPHSMHRDLTLKALEAGKHVLCEKPLAVSSKEAEEMVEASRKYNRALLTGFNFRFHPAHKILKSMIDPRKLIGGWIMDACSYLDMSPTYCSKRFGGGSLRTCHVHTIDLVRWALGEVVEVESLTGIMKKNAETEDFSVTNLRLQSGSIVQIMGSWWHKVVWLTEVRLFFEDSVIEGKLGVRNMTSESSSIKQYSSDSVKEFIPVAYGSPPWKEFSQSIRDQAKNFENVIAGVEKPVANGLDG